MLHFELPKSRMPRRDEALRGRSEPIAVSGRHVVLGTLLAEIPAGMDEAQFGMGCFWGAERLFWNLPGVHSTAVGYAGGYTPNPTYREVCSGMTGHAEVVRVVYDPQQLDFATLLRAFWEGHDPTQGMRQGNDVGTQYRSAVYCSTPAQCALAATSRAAFEDRLRAAGFDSISTEFRFPPPTFYFAEDEHQQYLAKNPHGYCGLGGTGVGCPVGLGDALAPASPEPRHGPL
jgi:peptide-methionine (S)-S-oxide reductase